MKAAVYFGQRDVRVIDVEEPKVKHPNHVKVKVAYCGICGSDVEEYLYGPIVIPQQPHILTGKQLPIIMGHEFTGIVVDTGEEVQHLNIGDEVVVNPVMGCGECNFCKTDTPCLCEKMACMGLGTDGAFAEYVMVPSEKCHKAPHGNRLDKLALTEPAAVGFRAIKKAGLTVGDNIMIIGAGTIGLFIIQMARIAGARQIFVTEVDPSKRKLAKKMGATVVFDPATDCVEEEIRKVLNNEKVDKIIVSAGEQSVPGFASELAAQAGLVILIGISPQPCPVNTNDIVISEKVLMGSHGYNSNDFSKTIQLLVADTIKTEDIINKKISLDDIVTKGFHEIEKNPSQHIKILVSP